MERFKFTLTLSSRTYRILRLCCCSSSYVKNNVLSLSIKSWRTKESTEQPITFKMSGVSCDSSSLTDRWSCVASHWIHLPLSPPENPLGVCCPAFTSFNFKWKKPSQSHWISSVMFFQLVWRSYAASALTTVIQHHSYSTCLLLT